VKTWCKSERKEAQYLLFVSSVLFFKVFRFTIETHLDKSISVSGSNNAGVWGRSPQPLEAKGGSGAEPPGAAAILQSFLKNTHF